ncbi:5-formyltetrahydrofolate cyclo-ligase [Constantimarinum furrinae]|uniref:5-formyltetrahydrofolate cyclo-ligase n=1 Tax=Constantimarinum furrinae TaxID=2562285 RepID=A0A7G8PSQ7_9FLAO|nr:5-formyltetrahydrofolate cyclo-ligase [Constantimarinum furrinae]QNJ97373.1 5,10-methenyltetrahydrofolate synthetase [Constantimarinum furrinae]
MEKEILRTKYRKLREKLSFEKIEVLSLEIANKLLEMDIWEKTYYHIFLPITGKKEVNTEYILHILQGKDKSVIIPKTNFESGEMTHILLQEHTALKISNYGIPEPESGIEVLPGQIEIVFVPLLAYDVKGNRVGYGKGFYDRFLAQCDPEAVFIGLSFFEPEASILHEFIDIPLNFCVTPHRTYKF